MNLQTIVPLKKEVKNSIDYNSKILLLGSCFSENIGDKLNYFKFQTNQNPFGILFHPKAIENLVTNAINKKKYLPEDLIFQNERWHCFDAHSSLSSADKNELLANLNSAITTTNKKLKEATPRKNKNKLNMRPTVLFFVTSYIEFKHLMPCTW